MSTFFGIYWKLGHGVGGWSVAMDDRSGAQDVTLA
jgi:hypothetical protein